MSDRPGTTGLVFEEPLLWEKGSPGRTAFSLPARDVASADLDDSIAGPGPDFPDLSELEVVRHYMRLSQWNFSVDTGFEVLELA